MSVAQGVVFTAQRKGHEEGISRFLYVLRSINIKTFYFIRFYLLFYIKWFLLNYLKLMTCNRLIIFSSIEL